MLGGILIGSGLINDEISSHAQSVTEQTGRLIGDVLVEEGYCKEQDIARELSRNLQLPYLDLRNYNLSTKLVEEFPAEILQKHQVIPVDRFGATVAMAMAQHLSAEGFKEIQDAAGVDVSFFVSLISQVRENLDKMAPVDKAKIFELRKNKPAPAAAPEQTKAARAASWTDIFDTANKNVTRTITRPAAGKRDTMTGLDICDSLNKKVIEGLKKDDKPKDDKPKDEK